MPFPHNLYVTSHHTAPSPNAVECVKAELLLHSRKLRSSTEIRAFFLALLCVILTHVVLMAGGITSAYATDITPEADPALTQVVESSENIAPKGTPAEVSAGHVDMGPKMVDGVWTMMVRDDSAEEPVWRYLDDVVFRVEDAAQLDIPDDEAYSFIHDAQQAWVVPQQELPGVVWLGWNTQDPAVVERVNGAVDLIYSGHQGEGNFYTFVQAGNFSGPQQLWNSELAESQPVSVDLNTHTHANWIFTRPGVHLVQITAAAQLSDGSSVESSAILRFAVGGETSTDAARAVTWEQSHEAEAPAQVQESSSIDESTAFPVVVASIFGAVAVVVVLIVVGLRVRTKRIQRAAIVDDSDEGSDGEKAAQ